MKNSKFTIAAGVLSGALLFPGMPLMADSKGNPGLHKGWEKKDHGHLGVPKGHLPPPGECRIWFPGKPPGHQPPPGNCRTLSRRVPRGAWLVGHDKIWRYDDHHDYRRPVYYGKPDSRPDRYYDGRGYSDRREIQRDIRDIRDARADLRQDQRQLQKSYEELKKDRAELRKDIRSDAGRKEIVQDRREIRQDLKQISAAKKDVRQSENKLEAARQELREDLRSR